jgi:hypothetical protein
LFFPVSFLAGALCLGASCDVPAQATAAAANTVTRAAAQQGVQSCLGRIQQITSALGYSPQSGAMLMLPPSDPDQRMIPLAMELPTGKDAAFVGVDFAPNQANGCGASYDAVVYWKQPCKTVASKNFSRLKPIGTLKKNVRILDGGLNVKVFLLPAGTGCVSIKKEVVL